jgi:calpain-15
MLLEKAYAKLYGSYSSIEAGLAGNALRDLTGAPSEYFIRDEESKLEADKCWQFIFKYISKDYILAASSETNAKVLLII